MKECKICHIVQDEENFYKRKDRNGEYTWRVSYCKSCEITRAEVYKKDNPEMFKESKYKSKKNYRLNHPDKIAIFKKRYYYKNLSPEKQTIYRKRLIAKSPELVENICG